MAGHSKWANIQYRKGRLGSLSFKKTGVITLAPGANEDKVMDAALEAGADDVVTNDDGSIEVLTTFEALIPVREALAKTGFKPARAEVTERPAMMVPLVGDDAERALKLLEVLEDLDDVQNVYTNADFPDALLAQAG